MIEHTFRILPSVGPKKEQLIWDNGIRDWDSFLSNDKIIGIKPDAKEVCDLVLNQASDLLKEGEAAALGEIVPRPEHWRMYRHFSDKAAYLDIETDGLSRDSLVTVVSVHTPKETTTLIHGQNLDAETLSDAIGDSKILVTFNGSCFDVPVLQNSFPTVDFDLPHYDLRFASRKVGYRGGLKPLEISLGIKRDGDIKDVDGAEAVRLWKRWERSGDKDSLNTLVEYNRADTINLEYIADTIYKSLVTDYAHYRW